MQRTLTPTNFFLLLHSYACFVVAFIILQFTPVSTIHKTCFEIGLSVLRKKYIIQVDLSLCSFFTSFSFGRVLSWDICMWGSTHRTWENGRRKNYLTRLFNAIIFVILYMKKTKTENLNIYIESNQKESRRNLKSLLLFLASSHNTRSSNNATWSSFKSQIRRQI